MQIVQTENYKILVRSAANKRKSPAALVATGFSWDLPDLNREPAGYESAAITEASNGAGFLKSGYFLVVAFWLIFS